MVADPKDQDSLCYEDVDPPEIRFMRLFDSHCLFFKPPNKARVNNISMFYSFAEVDVPGCYHHAFKKYHAYHEPTRRMVTLYVGNHRFGLRHPGTTSNIAEENWKVHPNQVWGIKAMLAQPTFNFVT